MSESRNELTLSEPPRLQAIALGKTFGRTTVLRNASLTIRRGEIHALVGENGSGKSTLIKILSGHHAPDPGGTVVVDGSALRLPVRQHDLRDLGVSVLHQDFGLVDEFTVVENVRIASFDVSRVSRRIDWSHERKVTREILDELSCDVDPRALVRDLTPADRARVAIGRALQNARTRRHDRPSGDGLLVFDESTRALPRAALGDFYGEINRLVSGGTSALLVSHNLEEVLSAADCVSVLRDGEVVAAGLPTSDLSERELVKLMLGYELKTRHRPLDTNRAAEPLRSAPVSMLVEEVTGKIVRDIDLAVHAGEVLGVTGLEGSGFEELPYLLAGALSAAGGSATVRGQRVDLTKTSVSKLIQLGVVLVPERRDLEGLALELSVLENLTLPRVRQRGTRMRLGHKWQMEEGKRAVEMLGIVPPLLTIPAGHFSGGNQQKVLLAKWLLGDPLVLMLHEPTQGVDVGARRDILNAIAALARSGGAVIIATIDLELLEETCDRVVVLRDGAIDRTLDSDITVHSIVSAIYGSGVEDASKRRLDVVTATE